MNAFDEAPDPRVLWPVDVRTATDDYGDEEFIVTELVWDPDDPCTITIKQYVIGCESDPETLAIFDRDMIAQLVDSYAPVGELGVRLEYVTFNQHQPLTWDSAFAAITIRPGSPDQQVFFTPRERIIGFGRAIVERCNTVAFADTWDDDLASLIGGAS